MAAGVSHVLRHFRADEMNSYHMDHQLPLMVPDRRGDGRVIRVVFADECPASDLETMRELVHARFSQSRRHGISLKCNKLSPHDYRMAMQAKGRHKQERRRDKRRR